MLRADIVVTHIPRLNHRALNNIFASGREIARSQHRRHAKADAVSDGVLDLAGGKLFVYQNGIGYPAVLGQQAEQKMLAADIGVPHILRVFNGGVEHVVGFLGEAGKLIHIIIPFRGEPYNRDYCRKIAAESKDICFYICLSAVF